MNEDNKLLNAVAAINAREEALAAERRAKDLVTFKRPVRHCVNCDRLDRCKAIRKFQNNCGLFAPSVEYLKEISAHNAAVKQRLMKNK